MFQVRLSPSWRTQNAIRQIHTFQGCLGVSRTVAEVIHIIASDRLVQPVQIEGLNIVPLHGDVFEIHVGAGSTNGWCARITWHTDGITEIRLPGRKALMACSTWCKVDSQNIEAWGALAELARVNINEISAGELCYGC